MRGAFTTYVMAKGIGVNSSEKYRGNTVVRKKEYRGNTVSSEIQSELRRN